MKKFTILLASLVAATASTFAQNEDPKGLYRLQRLGYENGRPDHVPELVQYKFFSDYVPVTILIRKNTPTMYHYFLKQDEPHPYKFTGDIPVGEDGRGTRIYDCDKNHVTVKWYNTIRPGDGAIFPMNEFIREYYDRENFEPQMKRSIEMLQMKYKQPKRRLAGCWHYVGSYGIVDGERVLTNAPYDTYKIFGDNDMVVLTTQGDRIMGSSIFYCPIVYKSETIIKENDSSESVLTWKNDSSFNMKTVTANGTIIEELWKRTELPETFRKLFNPYLPTAPL